MYKSKIEPIRIHSTWGPPNLNPAHFKILAHFVIKFNIRLN